MAPCTQPAWRLVIFDNDGVLVDSERLASGSLSEVLAACGVALTPDECTARFMGGSIGRVRAQLEAERGVPLPPDFEDRYHDRLFTRFRAGLRPVPGVARVVDLVGGRSCVASSGSVARIRLALEVTGLAGRFDGRWFSADQVRRGKPAPDLFLHAAAAMGVVPADAVVVEDSPLGVAAARAAGMRVLAYAATTPAATLAEADATFTDMAELPALLGLPG